VLQNYFERRSEEYPFKVTLLDWRLLQHIPPNTGHIAALQRTVLNLAAHVLPHHASSSVCYPLPHRLRSGEKVIGLVM
jgi:hypothetical protein